MHWAYRSLGETSRLLWTTRHTRDASLPALNRLATSATTASSAAAFTVASCSAALQHMHHVVNALRQTMLHTALHTAWATLTARLEAARGAEAGGLAVDGLARLHEEYLATIEAACWLDGSNASQVRSLNIQPPFVLLSG